MELSKGPVVLKFADTIGLDNFKLFEVDEHVLSELMEGANSVEIRGQAGQDAVLVTKTKTYAIRLVENSNTQLLVTPESGSQPVQPSPPKRPKISEGQENGAAAAGKQLAPRTRTIQGRVSCQYHLKHTIPRTHVVRELLMQNLYRPEENDDDDKDEEGDYSRQSKEAMAVDGGAGPEEEEEEEEEESNSAIRRKNLYSTAALRATVQASNAEIDQALREVGALELDGYWRMLDPDFTADVTDAILNQVMASNWRLDSISEAECVQELQDEFDPRVVRHCLRINSLEEEGGWASTDTRRLSAANVCLFRALQLFQEKEPYPHDEFMRKWEEIVPYGMVPTVDMLRGHALAEEGTLNLGRSSSSSSSSLDGYENSMNVDGGVMQHNGKGSRGMQWRYFPLHSLPRDPEARMRQLFARKRRWNKADLTPYVQSLCAPGQTLDQLLLQHTRAVRSNPALHPEESNIDTVYVPK